MRCRGLMTSNCGLARGCTWLGKQNPKPLEHACNVVSPPNRQWIGQMSCRLQDRGQAVSGLRNRCRTVRVGCSRQDRLLRCRVHGRNDPISDEARVVQQCQEGLVLLRHEFNDRLAGRRGDSDRSAKPSGYSPSHPLQRRRSHHRDLTRRQHGFDLSYRRAMLLRRTPDADGLTCERMMPRSLFTRVAVAPMRPVTRAMTRAALCTPARLPESAMPRM